jgi:hypothetical protein
MVPSDLPPNYDPEEEQDHEPSPWEKFLSKLGGRVGDLIIEFVGTFVAIGGIAVADLLVKWWLGEEKFFGLIPVQWVFDLGHICVVGRLIWRIFFPEKD